jgi:Fibronectin type III domain
MYPIDVLIGLRRTALVGILLSGLVAATPSSVSGSQSVTLAWNPSTNTDIANYEVYYGSASHTYTNMVTVGNVTNATISGLGGGQTYYFAAKAVTATGLQSDFSNEANYTTTNPPVPPVIQVAPTSLAYGTILSGASKTGSFTVSNSGGSTLSGSAAVSTPFSIVSGGTYNLGANQSQTVTVAFNPTTAGTYNQNVTLTGGGGATVGLSAAATNAPAPPVIQVAPTGLAYGSILSGTSKTGSFTVSNSGGSTLSGSAAVSTPFSIVSGGTYNLGANQSQTVTVAFNPTTAGTYNQNVTLTGGGGATVGLSAAATNAPAPPVIQVAPTSLAYGSILSGTSKTGSFTVSNSGGSTLSGSAAVSAPFNIVSGGTYNLGANQSQTVTVAFNPTTAGTYNQNVILTGGGGATVGLSATAIDAPVSPAIQVTPTSLAYGTILSGASKTSSFTVSNSGGGTLSGSAAVSAPFSIVSGGTYNLGANQSQTVTVVFNPTAAGTYNQNVTLTGGGGATIGLSAAATNAPPAFPEVSAISIDATDVDLSTPGLQVYSGTSIKFSATATNALTWQWSYTVNGGSPLIYSSGTGAVTNESYYLDESTAGNSYVWTLVVSNGQAWAKSQINFDVEAPPNPGGSVIQGPTFTANSGALNGLLTASTVINGVPTTYLYQPLPSIGSTGGGTAIYNINITNAGYYEIEALVYAPSLNANSFLVNVDDQPQNPTMIWDIMPVTSGFEQRVVGWRGNGSENNDQIAPKIFYLSAGPHQIIFVGRDPGTAMASFTLLQVVASGQSQSSSAVNTTLNSVINGSSTAQTAISSNNTGTGNYAQTLAVSVAANGIEPLTVYSTLNTNTYANYAAVAGQTVTFNATTNADSGPSALTYQWQRNSTNLPMANTANLTLHDITTNQSGTYTVVVSNGNGTTISSPITLTVYPTAAATLAGTAGAEKQFNVTVSGVPGYKYVVQASTNMVNWVPLQTNKAPFSFKDSDAGKFKKRFYRSIYVP